MHEKVEEEIVTKFQEILEKLTVEDCHHISWALFERRDEIKRQLEKMDCKECWSKIWNNKKMDYDVELEKLQREYEEVSKANSLFHVCHNWDNSYINQTGVWEEWNKESE